MVVDSSCTGRCESDHLFSDWFLHHGKHSRAYQYSFANGRKSIDAMPSVIASIPSIEVPYVLSHYSGNQVTSLSSLLKKEGYYSAFFHGAPNGSMGFQAFANTCGFDRYFGKDEYNHNEDYDGIWGIWDHKFLQYYAEQMNTFKQPFYTNFFSVSSHHPYTLPAEFQSRFKEGEMTIYKCIEYTDYALREFFHTASSMPWFKNTLFVITADHASAQTRLADYQSPVGYFEIPIFFYKPGADWHEMNPTIIQQIDIMPTILGELNYNKPSWLTDVIFSGTEPDRSRSTTWTIPTRLSVGTISYSLMATVLRACLISQLTGG
jgi:phosphoglycerol transferase MdoB-like AlkP superfamily enzyme